MATSTQWTLTASFVAGPRRSGVDRADTGGGGADGYAAPAAPAAPAAAGAGGGLINLSNGIRLDHRPKNSRLPAASLFKTPT